MITAGKGARRKVKDYMLTRYACYLIAQNGDPKKEEMAITTEHIQNNSFVCDMLGQRGIKPEELPPSEDIRKLERRVKTQEKKIVEQSGKFAVDDLHN